MRGCNKILDAWDSSLYKAVDVPADYLNSAYTVEPVNNTNQAKKVYRSSLRKSPTNPTKEQKEPRPKPVSRPTSDLKTAVSDEDESDEKLVLILPKEWTKPIPVPTGEPGT